jgi:hypothetical protein
MISAVAVGELTHDRAKLVLQGEKADIVYSDPPWGSGNLKYWRTMNKENIEVDWEEFLLLFCSIVASNTKTGAEIFVEMGCRWVDQLAEQMSAVGIRETQRIECTYRGGAKRYPNILWHSGTDIDLDYRDGGVTMTREVLASVVLPGGVVFDPCCGKGMTAKCAFRLGMGFVGIELNPKRAATALEIVERYRCQQ